MEHGRKFLMGFVILTVTIQLSHSGLIKHKHAGSETGAEISPEDPVQQLEELKIKLQTLEQSLEALDKNIETYVESEKKTKTEARRGMKHHVRTLEVQPPDQPQTDENLQNYIDSLSPEDKLTLLHMKAKLKYLQNVLNEPQHQTNPGEDVVREVKRSEVGSDTPPEDDAALAQFESELSQQDVLLLKKLKNKVKFLQGALHEGPHQANPGEEGTIQDKKSEVPLPDIPEPAQDEALHQFENKLSPEDQLLLKKFGAKVKFLQGALHEGHQDANPGEKRSEVTPDDPELQSFIQQLSPEDVLVLKKLQAKLKFLKGALHEGPQAPNPGEETADKREAVEPEGQDQALQNFLDGLTPEEKAAIQHHKEKLKYLQQALHEPSGQENPGEEETHEKRANTGAVAPVIKKPANPPVANGNQAQNPPANQVAPLPQTGANQIPALPAANLPQTVSENDIIFTVADRILLKAVSSKLEELRQSLENFKVVQESESQAAQQPVKPPIQAPVQAPVKPLAQAPVQQPAQKPAKAPISKTANTVVKPPTAAKIAAANPPAAKGSPSVKTRNGRACFEEPPSGLRHLRAQKELLSQGWLEVPIPKGQEGLGKRCFENPAAVGQFGDFVERRVQRELLSEGWLSAPIPESKVGLVRPGEECAVCGCPGVECPGAVKKSIVSSPGKVDLRQLLKALSEVKNTGRAKRLVDNDEDELEQLVIR